MMSAHRATLERRYDGPIPPADPALPAVDAGARARLFQRLAHEAREQAARRRIRLARSDLAGDARLDRLQRDLCLYRSQGALWRRLKAA